MAYVFSITLAVSIFGLFSILVLKFYELRSGRTLFRRLRPLLNSFFLSILWILEHVLPTTLQRGLRSGARTSVHVVRSAIVSVLRFFEERLETLLGIVRRGTQEHRSDREASTFLREVAEHKQSVLKDAPERKIFED